MKLEVIDEETKKVFNKLSEIEQKRLFIVSDVCNTQLEDEYKQEVSKVKVNVHQGVKCERCWNRFDEAEVTNGLCKRCSEAMKFYEKVKK